MVLQMELRDGLFVITASEIIDEAPSEEALKAPSDGKKVTQEEFDAIAEKKYEEMREMYGGKGGFHMRRH